MWDFHFLNSQPSPNKQDLHNLGLRVWGKEGVSWDVFKMQNLGCVFYYPWSLAFGYLVHIRP